MYLKTKNRPTIVTVYPFILKDDTVLYEDTILGKYTEEMPSYPRISLKTKTRPMLTVLREEDYVISRNKYDITFTITDGSTPVEDARIVLGGREQFTNALGVAVFRLIIGTFTYQITKTGYDTVTDTVVVDGDEAVPVDIGGMDADLTTYITGLTTPLSSGQLTLLNNFVTSLKTGLSITNLSDAFDAMYIFANETSEAGLRNLVKRSHDATLSATAPSFTALEGFTGNGSSSYIELNINLRTEGSKYELNSASHGIYFRDFERGTNKFNGVYSTAADGGIDKGIIIASGNSTQLRVAINRPVTTIIDSNSSGFYILTRTSSTESSFSRNKSHQTADTVATTGIPNQSVVTLARRTTDGTVGLYNTSQVSFEFFGKGFTNGQIDTIVDAFETYMDENGKGVIA